MSNLKCDKCSKPITDKQAFESMQASTVLRRLARLCPDHLLEFIERLSNIRKARFGL